MAKTLNGRVPTTKDIPLLASVDVRITEEGGVAVVVGVPIGTEGYVVERNVSGEGDGGADFPARSLAGVLKNKSSRFHCHRIPRTENQLPRAHHGHG